MSPHSISKLPTEILFHIAQDIEHQSHRLHLALCSHAFADLFLPFVYQDIELSNFDTNTINTPNTLIALVQTLLRNPRLASCTQTLGLNSWSTELNYEGNSYEPPETLPSPNLELAFDPDLIRDAVQMLFTSSDAHFLSKFMAHLSAGNEDAWIGLLLFTVPNLKDLSMSVPYGTFFSRRLVERAAARLPPFDSRPALTRLSHLFVKWYDTVGSLESSVVEPFFFFPSMRRVVGEQISDNPPTYEDEEPDALVDGRAAYLKNKPTISTVTEIYFSKSSTDNGMIAQIKFCKNLKSFKFEHADCFEYDSSFLPEDFARSLAQVKHSLENLCLTYDNQSFNGQDYEGEDEVFGSLAEYPVLKSLYIAAENLVGSDALFNPDDAILNFADHQRLTRILPTSIESLTLANVLKSYFPGILLQLKNLVEPSNFSRYTPRLTVLKIEGEFSISDEPNQPGIMMTLDGPEPVIPPEILDQAEGLQDLCAQVGVVFELVDTHIIQFRQLKDEWRKSKAAVN
ncbi:hypothetical protein GX50_01848 [[Emmonsia] crescens]|uniref:Leucine-rich repeat domain-containing protein n=1 Tax=[Emmonsia] crescens TaxID=73230 RepID=A0A2B7ZQ12_9EURO|nr:hypothetical protein GX50_01848 [Emmonsia crescens]